MVKKKDRQKILGLILIAVGISVSIFSLFQTERGAFDGYVRPNSLQSFGAQMEGAIGFYNFDIEDFSEGQVVINVLDPYGNTISNKMPSTSSSTETFDHGEGKYWIVVNNLSDLPVKIRIQLGSVSPQTVLSGAALILFGLAVMTYKRLKALKIRRRPKKK